MKKIKTIHYYLTLSITAVIITLLMIVIKPNTINTNIFTEKLIVIGAFFICCIFGISLAIYPNWWKKNKKNTNYNPNLENQKTRRSFKGHHPDCNKFKNHIIIIKNKPRCTGCLGLIIGAFASILVMILYLIIPLKLTINIYYILLIIGIIILFLVYGEILYVKRNRLIHIIINSLLIISFIIITLSILEITKNLIYAIIILILSFLWLNTRIYISNKQHHKICDSCTKECKSY